MNSNNPVLELHDVSKNFAGVTALHDINLDIFPGQVTAITGENGAGKSTLMKIVAGVYGEYEGKVMLNGRDANFSGPRDAADNGVIIVHQELNLIPEMTVSENIFLGREPVTRFGTIDYRKMNTSAGKLLSRLHLSIDPTTRVSRLRVGQQQLVEIARALLYDSKILIMDEPTSAITDQEIKVLFDIIRSLTSRGVAVLYISHKMKEIFSIADRYAVLRDGELVGSGMINDISHDGLIQMMVGRNLAESIKKIGKADEGGIEGKVLLKVENLCLRDPEQPQKFKVEGIHFELHEGEVLGIYGLMGAGRTELLESIFGCYPGYVSGTIDIQDKPVKIKSIRDAIDNGIALVPEDRKLQGLILNMTVAENTTLPGLDAISKFGFIRRSAENELSQEYIKKLHTQVPSEKMEVGYLSGGNQQKVVMSKWLATHPRILLLDEPTRGIDVGAKAEIYNLIHQLTLQGLGIIMVSSELPEILAVSDKVLVMAESRQTASLHRSLATEENIMKAALIQKNN